MAPVFPLFKTVRTVLVNEFHMEKKHFQHFLRLYNRKANHSVSELKDNGYTGIDVNFVKIGKAKKWCEKNLKDGAWVQKNHKFFFAYDKDATLFSLSI